MIEVLNDCFLPKEILFRDEQLKVIRQVFKNFQKFETGTNLIITGVTGSGKTTIIRKIVKEENNCIYVNGADTRTPVNTLKAICKVRNQSHGEVLQKTFEILKKDKKIIIIDEIDKIKNYKDFIDDLNTIYRRLSLPIILLTCKRNFTETISIDAKKTLWLERISLPSYTSIELQTIIKSRLELMDMKIPQINDHFINKLCAYGGKSGSCRITLNILLRCIQKNSFKISDLDEINKSLNDVDWRGFFSDLNETEKRFLSSLCNCCSASKECASYNVLQELKKFWNINLTQGRISQLIDFFVDYDILNSRHDNKGRAGGRRRLIKFKSEDVYNIMTDMSPC